MLLQPEFSNGSRVTLGSSFLTDNQPKMEEMINHFQPIITKLEEDYNEDFCGQTRVKIRSLPLTPTAPPALSRPKRSSGSQTQVILESNRQLLEAMQAQTNAFIQAQTTQSNAILEAIKAQPQPSLISGVDWTPLLQGALSVAAQALGVQVPTQAPAQQSAAQGPGEDQAINTRLEKLEQLIQQLAQPQAQPQVPQEILSRLDKLESIVANQAQAQTAMMQAITQLAKSKTSNSNNGSNDSTPPSTPPSSPAPPSTSSGTSMPTISSAPALPEIIPADPFKAELDLDKIVTADLESIITLGYVGALPAYEFFEPKRTSPKD